MQTPYASAVPALALLQTYFDLPALPCREELEGHATADGRVVRRFGRSDQNGRLAGGPRGQISTRSVSGRGPPNLGFTYVQSPTSPDHNPVVYHHHTMECEVDGQDKKTQKRTRPRRAGKVSTLTAQPPRSGQSSLASKLSNRGKKLVAEKPRLCFKNGPLETHPLYLPCLSYPALQLIARRSWAAKGRNPRADKANGRP
ncbi:hypothetical protein BDY21DRAFT_63026 [Lineolata rhizophorae]|uniref:Uncharacterized protein n=1 Tax=Lineolata rhizophorae TaxID=578093 RepID=A0A6A6NWP4_9PEZI|nr:hypothetical protein BDY21DRAFT_63026 [Lineolata rhizophorae]